MGMSMLQPWSMQSERSPAHPTLTCLYWDLWLIAFVLVAVWFLQSDCMTSPRELTMTFPARFLRWILALIQCCNAFFDSESDDVIIQIPVVVGRCRSVLFCQLLQWQCRRDVAGWKRQAVVDCWCAETWKIWSSFCKLLLLCAQSFAHNPYRQVRRFVLLLPHKIGGTISHDWFESMQPFYSCLSPKRWCWRVIVYEQEDEQ